MSERLKTMETALAKTHKTMDAEQKRSDLNRPREGRWASWYFLFIFIALTIGIGTSGYFYYKTQEKQLHDATNDQLNVVADLKVKQIVAWRNDRIEDAAIILKQSFRVHFVRQWLEDPADSNLKEKVSVWMSVFKENKNYQAIFLADAQGNTRISLPQKDKQISTCIQSYFAEAQRTKKIIFIDFHFVATTHRIHLALIIPLFDSDTSPFGFIVLEIDPYQFLYPFIQTWPTPSKTAETLLVRREGNEVVFLNELRHRKNTALTLRLPISRKDLPAVLAVQGKTGIVEGVDYRGVPVIATLRKIPDSPWFLASKNDVDETYALFKRQTWSVAIMVALLIALSGAGFGLLWRNQSAQFYKKQYETERKLATERKRTEEALQIKDVVIDSSINGITISDLAGNLNYVNDSFLKLWGYDNKQEVIGKSYLMFWNDPEQAKVVVDALRQSGRWSGELAGKKKDGSIITIQLSGNIILDSSSNAVGMMGSFIDVSERKQVESRGKLFYNVLALLNSSQNTMDTIISILRLIKQYMGYAAIGIRLREGEDFPYCETEGFSEDFLLKERYLCARDDKGNIIRDIKGNAVLECMCGNILSGLFDANQSFFTEGGSFWTNSTTDLLASTTEKERQPYTCNRCNAAGYESVALIPFKSNTIVIGLLQINDRNRNSFTLDLIHFFERLSLSIGIAVSRKKAEETLRVSGRNFKELVDKTTRSQEELEASYLELKASKDDLVRSEKLAYTGRIAASIAHEIRNPLTNVSMSVRQLKKSGSIKKPEGLKHGEIIERNVERINFLITELLNCARPAKLNLQPYDIHRVIKDALIADKGNIGSQKVKVAKFLSAKPSILKIDKEHMGRVLLNLITNAIDAMSNGGNLTISTERDEDLFLIKVEDTGKGIPEKDIIRIFDPFFSTNPQGVGLGLTTCYGIIVSHGGTIEVESKWRKGTTFIISLPIEHHRESTVAGKSL